MSVPSAAANVARPCSDRRSLNEPTRQVGRGMSDPSKVLRSFNTWAFKRAQPSDPELLLKVVSQAALLGTPVPFVLYWGKGPRDGIGAPDLECLDYLLRLADRVRDAHTPAASVTLIFTDTHAKLNGHSSQGMLAYFDAVRNAAHARGFKTCWLSEITQLVQTDSLTFQEPSPELLQKLSACAARWYRGDGTTEEGAFAYYWMNMVERRAVELAFPESIFITFNGNEFQDIFPDTLPVFYMYSLRRGVAVKPWFISSDGPHPTSTLPSVQDDPPTVRSVMSRTGRTAAGGRPRLDPGPPRLASEAPQRDVH